MSSADPPGYLERVLLAAGTKTYQHGAEFDGGLGNLKAVPRELQSVVASLTGLGYIRAGTGDPGYLINPSLQRLKDAVRAAASSAPVVVVYYTGHGVKPESGHFCLLTTDSRPRLLGDTALAASEILELVLRRDVSGKPAAEQPQVLAILDCCFAGAGGVEVLEESLKGLGNPNVWFLASAGTEQYAEEGRFAAALAEALRKATAGPSQPYVGPDWIAQLINSALKEANADQEARCFPPSSGLLGLPPFFPNPDFIPGLAGRTVAEQHWVNRLRGAPAESATAGFYVTGRTGRMRVAEDLAEWMRDPDRGALAVVTGSPGCGKSAMLALPVLLTSRERRTALVTGADRGSLAARAADLFDGLPVLGVHARGLNPYEVARAIAEPLGRSADNPSDLLTDLDGRPETSPRILVIDAVDEARDPEALLTGLLLPLARRPGLRIVVGARRHLLFGVDDADLTIDLDTEEYRDPQALAGYAHQLLIAAHEPDVASPYRGRHDDTVVTVAAGIAEKATEPSSAAGQAESFLLAQLLARAVRGRQQVLDVTHDGWARQLPANVGAAFDEDLRHGLGGRQPTARALLAALAWAKGPGLPWESIWVPVAQALATRAGTGALDLDRYGVRSLLDNAGAYIVEDVGPGQRSVFRPFHDLLAAHLREQPSDEQFAADPTAADAWQQRRQQAERDITRVLVGRVPVSSDGKADWELAHPYLRTYLAQHAAAAGPSEFSALVQDPDFLAVADPVTLSSLLLSSHSPELADTTRVYQRARPLLSAVPRANAAYLQEAGRALTNSTAEGSAIRPLYRTHLALVREDDSLLTLTGRMSQVFSVAFGVGPDGRLLLASGGGDGTVRLWDPVTGAPQGGPLRGHTRGVNSVAFGVGPDGRLLLASGGGDGTVRLWDPVTGRPQGGLLTGRTRGVNSVAFGVGPDGRLLLASGCGDGAVRVWDPVTGRPQGGPLTARIAARQSGYAVLPAVSPVLSVAFGVGPDGRLLLASGCGDGTVRVWDPVTGRLQGSPLTHHGSAVNSVAFGVGPDGRLLLVTGSVNQMVQVWDPLTGVPQGGQLRGHVFSVFSVAFGIGPDGRLLLASGGGDGTVRLWDPVTGAVQGGPLRGHTRGVNSVAFGVGPDGRLLLASGSDDGTVRVWDPVTGARQGGPLTRHHYGVNSVAFGAGPDGRLLLATGSDNGWLRVWDPVTSAPRGDPLTSYHREMNSMACWVGPDGRLLLAFGYVDGNVQVSDPVTGVPQKGLPTGHTGPVNSVAFGVGPGRRLLLASGSDDGTVRVWDPVTGRPQGGPLTTRIAVSQSGSAVGWAVSPVLSVAFGVGPHGRLLLASGSDDGTVRVWDPVTGKPQGSPLRGHTSGVNSVAFGVGPDGRLLLASGSDDGTVRVWDPVTGRPEGGPLTGHTGPVFSVVFGADPDGRLLLATSSEDRTVRVWNPTHGTCTAALERRYAVRSIAVAGPWLAIGDEEGVYVIEVEY